MRNDMQKVIDPYREEFEKKKEERRTGQSRSARNK